MPPFGLGIGLAAGVQSALGTWKQFKDAESQDLRDQAARLGIQNAQLDLDEKQKRATASTKLDEITKQYFGGETRSDPSGDYGPGEAPNIVTPINFDALNDPDVMAKYQAAAFPHVQQLLGPEKGHAFLKEYQDAVQARIPQAAAKFKMGDFTGGLSDLKAGTGKWAKDITSAGPHQVSTDDSGVVQDTGGVVLKFGPDGSKGTLVVKPEQIARMALKPGEFLKDMKEQQELAIKERTANTAQAKVDLETQELRDVKIPEAKAKVAAADNLGLHYKAMETAADATRAATVETKNAATEVARQGRENEQHRLAVTELGKLTAPTIGPDGEKVASELESYAPGILADALAAAKKNGTTPTEEVGRIAAGIKDTHTKFRTALGDVVAKAAKGDTGAIKALDAELAKSLEKALAGGVSADEWKQQVARTAEGARVNPRVIAAALGRINTSGINQKGGAPAAVALGGPGVKSATSEWTDEAASAAAGDPASIKGIPGPPPSGSRAYPAWEKVYGDKWRAAQKAQAVADAAEAKRRAAIWKTSRENFGIQ